MSRPDDEEKAASQNHTHMRAATSINKPLDPEYTAKFWNKVDKTPGQGPEGECWSWNGIINNKGYGHFSFKSENENGNKVSLVRGAHRVSFLIDKGYLPALDICHSCDNPRCVNPEHIRSGTKKENMQDRSTRGRNTFKERETCSKGHAYPENVYKDKRGVRRCPVCQKQWKENYLSKTTS